MKTIIAQTGAGKTTFCKTHKWCKDGDDLTDVQAVYAAMRRNYGNDWVTDNFDAARPEYIRLMKASFNRLVGRDIWVAISTTLFATPSSIFVIPDLGVVSRQLLKPRPGHDPAHDAQRSKRADNDRKTYVEAATRMHCIVFKSFDALVDATVM